MTIRLEVTGDYKLEIFPDIKKIFIRRNRWDNYAVFIGTREVLDGARKDDLLERAQEIYPNAKIIDKTL